MAIDTAALTEDGHVDRTYDLTGPLSITHAEIADALAQALGRPVTFHTVASEAFVQAVVVSGMPRWQAEGLAEDYEHYEREEAATVSHDIEKVTGHPARSVAVFANDYAPRFRAG